MSGFHLLGSGIDAFVARMALAEAAERTLDLQYYIFRGDFTVKLILESVLRAAERGVRVRIMVDDTTLGVELYEIKPPLVEASEQDRKPFGSSGASLHAKFFVFDRRQLFVGSLNLDPRSLYLNTELGIVVDSPELAKELARQFEGLVQPEYSYHLSLNKPDGDLVWISEENGREVRYTRDPEVGFWRRFSTWFLSIFAPEYML
jgi:phosphatidylserine/phosphatidylglycerophosphate/cardiolipin synthase-like enzyme